jgi:EAL domain-containing protein (putative c-di-GMP-specific phosphodiesterase class I)
MRMRFDKESFVHLLPFEDHHKLPELEMLARPVGITASYFFDEARKYNRVIDIDLMTFERAVAAHLISGKRVSINLNAETFFSDRLWAKLDEISLKYPEFNPKNICLEITEQGGIPKNFDPQALLALKARGFSLALDDFDHRDPKEWQRLALFAPYVDIVKCPYQVMETVREASLDSVAFADDVRMIKIRYPHLKLVMEGVRSSDNNLYPTLEKIGFDIIQPTSYVTQPKADQGQKVAFPEHGLELAQPA